MTDQALFRIVVRSNERNPAGPSHVDLVGKMSNHTQVDELAEILLRERVNGRCHCLLDLSRLSEILPCAITTLRLHAKAIDLTCHGKMFVVGMQPAVAAVFAAEAEGVKTRAAAKAKATGWTVVPAPERFILVGSESEALGLIRQQAEVLGDELSH